jgi:hypothetical protein
MFGSNAGPRYSAHKLSNVPDPVSKWDPVFFRVGEMVGPEQVRGKLVFLSDLLISTASPLSVEPIYEVNNPCLPKFVSLVGGV